MLKYIFLLTISIFFVFTCSGEDTKDAVAEVDKLSGSTTPESRDSFDEKYSQKICSTIEQHVVHNDISALVDLYHQVSENPDRWSSENIQQIECMASKVSQRSYMLSFKTRHKADQNIALLFYPDQYIKKYYGRSFDKLNEAAKFCILIAARYGHQISREMIANGFPFQESDKAQKIMLRFPGGLAAIDRMAYVLQTPFALNYNSNLEIFNSEEGNDYLESISKDMSGYDPIVIMNAGYVKFLQGQFNNAYHLFMAAGEKGIMTGYTEAAGIILRSKNNSSISIDGVHYYQDEDAAERKIKEILGMAGVRGRWELATHYRFGDIKNTNNNDWGHVYFKIAEAGDNDDPRYSYQVGGLYAQFAIGRKDIDEKREDYETALSFFIDTMKRGEHSAYRDAQKVAKELLPLMTGEDKKKAEEEINSIINEHSGILTLLEQEESLLIGSLLSE